MGIVVGIFHILITICIQQEHCCCLKGKDNCDKKEAILSMEIARAMGVMAL